MGETSQSLDDLKKVGTQQDDCNDEFRFHGIKSHVSPYHIVIRVEMPRGDAGSSGAAERPPTVVVVRVDVENPENNFGSGGPYRPLTFPEDQHRGAITDEDGHRRLAMLAAAAIEDDGMIPRDETQLKPIEYPPIESQQPLYSSGDVYVEVHDIRTFPMPPHPDDHPTGDKLPR